jgi:hypothetical protein
VFSLRVALATSHAGMDTDHRILEGYTADVMCVGVQTYTIGSVTQKRFGDEGTLSQNSLRVICLLRKLMMPFCFKKF